MSRTADFLVEIGTEELPPKALPSLENAFASQLREGIAGLGLASGILHSYATPRRLAVLVENLDLVQAAKVVEKRGPPVGVAFDAQGRPTRAALAFAEGCGVPIEQVGRQETPKGAWLMHRAELPGRPAAELLGSVVEAALAALPIPRRMRWGNGTAEFVRPVHWVVMLLGTSVLTTPVLGLVPGRVTRGHRFHAPDPLTIASPGDYAHLLATHGHVLPDFSERRSRVRGLAEQAAREAGGTALFDADLLDEVTSLVEWPVPVLGRFPAKFLELPEEVLVATLQGHQRYFPVRGPDGRLLPAFVTMANLDSREPEQVRLGNERVVIPRLSDAAFFWAQDRQVPLARRAEQLGTVVFQQGLGTLADRAARVGSLGAAIAEAQGQDAKPVRRAAALGKADLLTQMVGEFPELQGRMGYHYALHDGESDLVAVAIEEQYLPRHAGDRLPATPAGRILSIAERVDTLAGIFALGKRPSGSKDPFGLRRAALGLLRILVEHGVDLDLRALFARAVSGLPVTAGEHVALVDELFDFVLERARAWYLEGLAPGLPAGVVTAEMFEAVRLRRPVSLVDFHARLAGVCAFMALPEANSLATANKRIANILRNAQVSGARDMPVTDRFEFAEERSLHAAVLKVEAQHRSHLERRDYQRALTDLATLRTPVDAYFEAVLVMADDPAVRSNRLAQLRQLRELFLDVADLSCMPAA
jgi:glycyl-tRNA synthetase beta chain